MTLGRQDLLNVPPTYQLPLDSSLGLREGHRAFPSIPSSRAELQVWLFLQELRQLHVGPYQIHLRFAER